MNPRELIARAARHGVILIPAGPDKLKMKASHPPPPDLVEALRQHKTQILAELSTGLPARVRQRFRDACMHMSIDPAPVLEQFDRWRYSDADLREMDTWRDETVRVHIELLASEIAKEKRP